MLVCILKFHNELTMVQAEHNELERIVKISFHTKVL